MKKIFLVASVFIATIICAQEFVPAYQNRANLVSQANINSYLQEFASFGIKTTGSNNEKNAFTWLKNKYASFGYTTADIVEDPYSFGSVSSKNLVVTKKGTKYPDTFVIISGHYDTISGPGVNDNGSGISIILEIARILKNIPTEYSVKFINFSGEEQGLYGSSHYVRDVVNATNPKMKIKMVLNLDQVGGVLGNVNDTVYCDVDSDAMNGNNPAALAIAQQLAKCTTLYSPLKTAYDRAEDTDYIPFKRNGELITGFFEFKRSNLPHTPNDTYANMDPVYVYNIGKAAMGAAQHFATADITNLSIADFTPEEMLKSLKIYPNPSKDYINLEILNHQLKNFKFEITDMTGKLLLEVENQTKINVSKLEKGIYIGTLIIEDKSTTKKIMID